MVESLGDGQQRIGRQGLGHGGQGPQCGRSVLQGMRLVRQPGIDRSGRGGERSGPDPALRHLLPIGADGRQRRILMLEAVGDRQRLDVGLRLLLLGGRVGAVSTAAISDVARGRESRLGVLAIALALGRAHGSDHVSALGFESRDVVAAGSEHHQGGVHGLDSDSWGSVGWSPQHLVAEVNRSDVRIDQPQIKP